MERPPCSPDDTRCDQAIVRVSEPAVDDFRVGDIPPACRSELVALLATAELISGARSWHGRRDMLAVTLLHAGNSDCLEYSPRACTQVFS